MSANPGQTQRRQKLKPILFEAQVGACACGSEPLPPPETWKGRLVVSLDHVYPRGRYPERGDRGNLLLTHAKCNELKANRMPTPEEVAFLERVNARMPHKPMSRTRSA
jgi:hypothetical protein